MENELPWERGGTELYVPFVIHSYAFLFCLVGFIWSKLLEAETRDSQQIYLQIMVSHRITGDDREVKGKLWVDLGMVK